AESVPGVLSREAQDDARRASPALRSADPQSAFAAAGQGPVAGLRPLGLARGDLGHSFGSSQVRADLARPRRCHEQTCNAGLSIAVCAAPAFAADDAATRKDLTSVIALQGLPCGEVVSVKTQGENDYIATCKDKNRYHVYVNSTGRVVAEKQ